MKLSKVTRLRVNNFCTSTYWVQNLLLNRLYVFRINQLGGQSTLYTERFRHYRITKVVLTVRPLQTVNKQGPVYHVGVDENMTTGDGQTGGQYTIPATGLPSVYGRKISSQNVSVPDTIENANELADFKRHSLGSRRPVRIAVKPFLWNIVTEWNDSLNGGEGNNVYSPTYGTWCSNVADSEATYVGMQTMWHFPLMAPNSKLQFELKWDYYVQFKTPMPDSYDTSGWTTVDLFNQTGGTGSVGAVYTSDATNGDGYGTVPVMEALYSTF